MIIWRKSCCRGHKCTAIFVAASLPHSIQLFNTALALLLYCIFHSQLCSLNTECYGLWADFVSFCPLSPRFYLHSSPVALLVTCFWRASLKVDNGVWKSLFPLPNTHRYGSMCPVCQPFFTLVNQELVQFHFPLLCLFTFLQLSNFYKSKGSGGVFKVDKLKMSLLSYKWRLQWL